ncbi:PREDICTED: probable methyltransferase PMT26 isoform X4 [Lupinus angustifolius]|uniref:probable methyltransferase PMT26 isoform X4 n=1 Tax=Lupinus angustifolius TaxID=3871 RepID=UPI00092EDC1D|nr:PREDICTED: probable methyltransferase PMT26 isoform X4 [Lupinus angustifolius]
MATAKYTRIDNNKRPSNYCSTVTIVVFLALCLVGVWIMTSSSSVPAKEDIVQETNNNEVKQPVTDTTSNTNTQKFDDNPGDISEDSTKGDNSVPVTSEDNPAVPEKQEEKLEGKNEEKSSEDNKTEDGGDNKTEDKDSQTENAESNSENKKDGVDNSSKGDSEETSSMKSDSDESSKTTEEKVEERGNEESDESSKSNENKTDDTVSGAQSDIVNESTTQNGSFSTQATESNKENESQGSSQQTATHNWKVCNVTAGSDYIPCLDNMKAIKQLKTTKHYEHRERHCPEEPPTCLVSLPEGYRRSIEWPKSREKIWYYNIPHTQLAEYKGHQNWVKVTGEYLTFPGGGTQFMHGALHYIDVIQQSVPDISWGKRSRVILDVGCGVASFGGFLFDRDTLTMSFAPKDEHEAQVQFALERGIPAISAVMGTKRLPYPGRVFDVVHCARCRVPWHIEGGKLLLELNRLLRPGGFFVWSATPIYQKLPEDVEIWNAMKELTKAMCWEVVSITRDRLNGVGIAVYKKTNSNECYEKRSKNEPPICPDSDDPDAAWNVTLQACMHKVPMSTTERGSQWPEQWPARLTKTPYWLRSTQVGVYGKPAPEDFTADYEHWKGVVPNYLNGMGIQWLNVRNVMDMRAVYGGFAAALKDLKIWVMNIVPVDSPDTLPIIYERGLFGIYHDWCESFSTYPRSYDILHADHLFSKLKKRCNFEAVVAEIDRVLRPEGTLIVRDTVETITELENLVKSMQWEVRMSSSKDNEGILSVQKSMWRPKEVETLEYSIGVPRVR